MAFTRAGYRRRSPATANPGPPPCAAPPPGCGPGLGNRRGHGEARLHIPPAVEFPHHAEEPHPRAVQEGSGADVQQVVHRPQRTARVARGDLSDAGDSSAQPHDDHQPARRLVIVVGLGAAVAGVAQVATGNPGRPLWAVNYLLYVGAAAFLYRSGVWFL